MLLFQIFILAKKNSINFFTIYHFGQLAAYRHLQCQVVRSILLVMIIYKNTNHHNNLQANLQNLQTQTINKIIKNAKLWRPGYSSVHVIMA
jgi:hypothetical protein